jgi:hypothetical protein
MQNGPQHTGGSVMDALAAEVAQFIKDPLAFVYWAFPWGVKGGPLEDQAGPDAWQIKTLTRIRAHLLRGDTTGALQIAVSSGHGIGKTTLIAWVILWFMSVHEDPQVVVTANTMQQLNGKTWRELAKWHRWSRNAAWFKWTATRFSMVDRPDTWFASAVPWSKERAQAFAGTHEKHVLVIFDEASMIADIIWETAEGAMTTPGSMWIAFGNPTHNTGRFRECFPGGRFEHRWVALQIDSRTAKMADKPQIEKWIEDYGEDSDFVRVRVRGIFPRAASNQLIPEDLVSAAFERWERNGGDKWGGGNAVDDELEWPLVLGVDIARYGDDQTVVYARKGPVAWKVISWRELDTMQTAGRIAALIAELEPHQVFVDAIGIGAGVYDRLRQLNYSNVVEVISSERAREHLRHANKRVEMWVDLLQWLKREAAIKPDNETRADLVGPQYGFDQQNRYQLEKKEDMKTRGLSSPDDGDAIALTFAEVVVPIRKQKQIGAVAKAIAGLSRGGGGSFMGR